MRSAWAWNCRPPGVAHGARRHRRKHRRALRHVRVAILAHHVVAHQRVHQSRRLVRGEHVDAFFLAEDIVAPGEDRRAELRHERDRRFLPHPRQRPDRDRPRTPRRRCRNAGRWTWRFAPSGPCCPAGAIAVVITDCTARHVEFRRPNIAGSCCAACAPRGRARARRGCGCRRSAPAFAAPARARPRRRWTRSATARLRWEPAKMPEFPARGIGDMQERPLTDIEQRDSRYELYSESSTPPDSTSASRRWKRKHRERTSPAVDKGGPILVNAMLTALPARHGQRPHQTVR